MKNLLQKWTPPMIDWSPMRATSFQKPFEFTLKTEGESWNQAGRITGTLEVRSHGEAPRTGHLRLFLAVGELKKVRAKDPSAFSVLSSALTSDWFPPRSGETRTFEWAFDLDHNIPISDSQKSPFLVFGWSETEDALPPGSLPLQIIPEPAIQELLKTLTTAFRFVIKTQRSVKAGVETKLAPPDSKAFSSLESLTLISHFEADVLHVEYRFTLKKMQPTVANVQIKKVKESLNQEFAPMDYLLPSGRMNFEFFEKQVQEALRGVERAL